MRPVLAIAGALFLAAGLAACPAHGPPGGPPPEYERPVLPPWEAAAPRPPPGEDVEEPAEAPADSDAGAADAAEAGEAGAGDAGPAR